MGLRISADESVPPPRPISLGVMCDGEHGFLPVPAKNYSLVTTGSASYLAARKQATDEGWLIGSAGRVLCAACRMAKR